MTACGSRWQPWTIPRRCYCALGDGTKRLEANETGTVIVQRRSVRAARNLPVGQVLVEGDLMVLPTVSSEAPCRPVICRNWSGGRSAGRYRRVTASD